MEEYGKMVITSVSEAYTSKTCSWCGYIKKNLGGSKVFRCDSCKLQINRDLNGAQGIFLRALLDGATIVATLIVTIVSPSVQCL